MFTFTSFSLGILNTKKVKLCTLYTENKCFSVTTNSCQLETVVEMLQAALSLWPNQRTIYFQIFHFVRVVCVRTTFTNMYLCKTQFSLLAFKCVSTCFIYKHSTSKYSSAVCLNGDFEQKNLTSTAINTLTFQLVHSAHTPEYICNAKD